MIEIALCRTESQVVAGSTVSGRVQGESDQRWRDKSADVRRAHLVGWVEILTRHANRSDGAFQQNLKIINATAAVAHRQAASMPS
jgi:hypothetical protein